MLDESNTLDVDPNRESVDAHTTLKIVSGRRGFITECKVIVNGLEVGSVGETICVPAGHLSVMVDYPPYACNRVEFDLPAGSHATLDFNYGCLACSFLLLGGFIGLMLFMLVATEFKDQIVTISLFFLAIAAVIAVTQRAIAIPIWLLARIGWPTHSLRLVRIDSASTRGAPTS